MPAPRSTVNESPPTNRVGMLVAELHIDAAVALPAGFVGAGRVELTSGRVEELVRRDAEAGEEVVRSARALRAEGHVVLGLATRVSAADEIDSTALQWTGRQTLGDLLEDRLLLIGELLGVEVELRRLFDVGELQVARL